MIDGRAGRHRPVIDGHVVGVDVGGSKIAVLVADRDGRAIGGCSLPTAVGAPHGAASTVASAVEEALRDAGVTRNDVVALGVGVPGRVDRATGTVTHAVNLGWNDLDLGPQLEALLGVPVTVENDVRAAAAGLHRRRVVGKVASLAYLSIGTGISAGVVLGGRLHRGARGMAGEIGHIVLDAGGPECACGLRGCFEALAAGPGIARRATEAIATGDASALAATTGPTAIDVYVAAAAGDALARRLVDEVGGHVARAIHELVMAYDVEVVVLGGGVARAGATFLDPILAALDVLRDRSPLARDVLRPGVVQLLPPDAQAGAWGAVILAADAAAHAGRSGRAAMPIARVAGEGGG